MPRTPNEISQEILDALKQEVLVKYRRPLKRSIDCDHLARKISEKTKTNINGISFKRLFGFTKYPYNPSYQTLDILSNYVGKEDWHTFKLSFEQPQELSNSELDIILSIYDFDFINDINNYEGGIQSVSRTIAKTLRKNPKSFKKIIEQLAKLPSSQVFYIEHFPDYDNLINFYYVAFEEYLKHKKTKEGQLYGNSLLFLKAFWENNEEECRNRVKRINKIGVDDRVHPFVIGRYYASNLLFDYHYSHDQLDFLIKQIFDTANRMPKSGNHFLSFPAFQYIISEAFLHCNLFNECVAIIDSAFEDYPLEKEFVRKGYYRQMQLFKSFALWEIQRKEESLKLLQKIDPSSFYFISEKYFKALYLIHKYRVEKNYEIREHADRLINEMGNKFLSKKLDKIVEKEVF